MNKNINKITTTALVGAIGVNFTPVMTSEKSDVISAKDRISYGIQAKDSNDIELEVINNVCKGSITIKYIDDTTGDELILSIVEKDLQLGDHTIQAELILDYELIGDAPKTITLTETNPYQVVEFRYTELPEISGYITVLYIDDKINMKIGPQTVHSDLLMYEYTVTAHERDGYTIVSDYDKKVTLTKVINRIKVGKWIKGYIKRELTLTLFLFVIKIFLNFYIKVKSFSDLNKRREK